MNLSDLLTRPTAFFTALAALQPRPTRFIWLVLGAGLLSGADLVLLNRSLVAAQQAPIGPPFPLIVVWGEAIVFEVLSALFFWLLWWGTGTLGAGRKGRAAEVYGAIFLITLIWWLIALPLCALFAPVISTAPPSLAGLDPAEQLQIWRQHLLTIKAEYTSAPIVRLITWVRSTLFLWQLYLAWTGFRVLTGSAGKAWRGVLIPVVVMFLLWLGFSSFRLPGRGSP